MTEESILEKAESYISGLFKVKLPKDLYYHNLDHTREVVERVKEIADGVKLEPDEREMVMLAAWFHDAGYIYKYVGHEEESVDIATEALRNWGYPEDCIQVISNCIIATKFRHESENLLESVLIDADRLSMGRTDFMTRGEALRKEWEIYLKKEYNDLEWTLVQEQYLADTRFLTPYCQKNYGDIRTSNIKLMKEKRLRTEQEENPIVKQSQLWREQIRAQGGLLLLSLVLGQIIALTLSLTLWGSYGYSFWIGIISGLFIGIVLRWGDSRYDKYVIRRFSFPATLFLGAGLLVCLFKFSQMTSFFIYEWVFENRSWQSITETPEFEIYTITDNFLSQIWIAFLMSLILNFVKLTSRIVGPRMMLSYLYGKYHKPVEEERIFMFIDLNSSTAMAEQMETTLYHQLLDHFFYDIAAPVSRYKGEIYQYVGDEVVITWKMEDGIKHSNCVRCYFRIVKQLEKLRDEYTTLFGFMPDYKAALHGGKVVSGEVGKNKIEIVFHGDVINTTERIVNQCKPLGKKILISEDLLRRIDLLPHLHCEYVTTKLFKGKENEVSLYTLTKD